MNKLSRALIKLPTLNIIFILLGTMMLYEFYSHWAFGNLTPQGLQLQIHGILTDSHTPNWWKNCLNQLSAYTNIMSPVLAIFLFLTGAGLLLGLFRSWLAIIVGISFGIGWFSLWNYPGTWIFEYLFPSLFALCAGFAFLTHRLGNKIHEKILGEKIFGNTHFSTRILIILFSTFFIWTCIILSKDGLGYNSEIAWKTAISFFVLLFISAGLDYWRSVPVRTNQKPLPWLDIMAIIIGAMLVIQVYADIAVHFFTEQGYASLTHYYSEASSMPQWFKGFLTWSSEHASWLAPIQFIFESSFAICLVLLLWRGPMLFLASGLLFLLMFSEFGVSAVFPAGPNDPRNWAWELMFVSIVSLFMAFNYLGWYIKARNIKQKLLGPSFYGNLSMVWRILIAILGGFALWGAGMATHVFGPAYAKISLQAGITFGVLLLILGIIDKWRTPNQSTNDPKTN